MLSEDTKQYTIIELLYTVIVIFVYGYKRIKNKTIISQILL